MYVFVVVESPIFPFFPFQFWIWLLFYSFSFS